MLKPGENQEAQSDQSDHAEALVVINIEIRGEGGNFLFGRRSFGVKR